MYQLKYGTAFCNRFSKYIDISYVHLITKDSVLNDGLICAEAKIHYTCLEKDSCTEMNCTQNNYFGQSYLQSD